MAKKETTTITVTDVDKADTDYIKSTGLAKTVFIRMAIKEKRARDSK